MTELSVLFLLIVANGSPVVSRALFGKVLAGALDRGWVLADGHRLLGSSKTLRGLITALLTTTVFAPLVGFSWYLGLTLAAFSMIGDAFSSFVKRRLGLASGARAPGLDQIPESLFPLLVCKAMLALSWTEILILTIAFTVSDLAISRVLYHLGIRHHPY
jgi:CDP-2,3-bis-(O-geranylgeranyl)-sn-glycerol synthase